MLSRPLHHTSRGRPLVIAVLLAFVVGFGSGAVTAWRIGDPVTETPPQASRDLRLDALGGAVGMAHRQQDGVDTLLGRARSDRLMPESRALTGSQRSGDGVRDGGIPPAPVVALSSPPRALSHALDTAELAAGTSFEDPWAAVVTRSAHQVDVRRGDTLMDILTRFGIRRGEAHAAITTLADVYDPRRLRVGQQLALEVEEPNGSEDGPQLASLSLNVDFAQNIVVTRDEEGGFSAATIDRALQHATMFGAGTIDDSFYLSGTRSGVPPETLAEIIRVFSWDVDFQRDIHPGDRFEVMFETMQTEDGNELRGGDLVYASLSLRGRSLDAYRFEREDGSVDYFDGEGRSLRKFLLRTPIDGARLSSGFGPRRHPILGYNRMHRGVDFAAPTGTPIFAAGDGTVEFVGSNRGYGNYVKIRHNSTYTTLYAHLSRFAQGLKRGDRVRQGQAIGQVGATGMATGPHLHYEVHKQGDQVNPLEIDVAEAEGLSGGELARLRRKVAEIDLTRQGLGRGTVVATRTD